MEKLESININDENGIRGFQDDAVAGTQRFVTNLETVTFTPFNFYGFRFALFGFLDMAFIWDEKNDIFTEDFYSGLGFGIRIRNEKLVFKTFQIRLGFYPNSNSFKFSISGEDVPEFEQFIVSYPKIIPFE